MTYVARLPSSDICLKETKQRRSYAMVHVYDVYVHIKHNAFYPQKYTLLWECMKKQNAIYVDEDIYHIV